MALRSLDQRDVRNLLRHFADPTEEGSALVQAQALGIVIRSGHHPGLVAERRILGARAMDAGALQAARVLSELTEDVRRHLEAVFEPEPERFAFTRQQAGIDYVTRSAPEDEGRGTPHLRLIAQPHDPYLEPHEAALLRHTPTLQTRARRALEREHRDAVRQACQAGGADAADVEHAADALHCGLRGQDVELRVVDLIEKAIANARCTKDVAAREAARKVLATAKREAGALYDAAADAYAGARATLYPPKRGPRRAPAPVHALSPEAWLDAAE